jgi:spermidine export protein MdtI
MQQFEWIHAAWLAIAIVLEIIANVFLKFSDGFRRKVYGILSLAAVLGAFSALSQAVKGIDLSVPMRCGAASVSRRPSPPAGCCLASA